MNNKKLGWLSVVAILSLIAIAGSLFVPVVCALTTLNSTALNATGSASNIVSNITLSNSSGSNVTRGLDGTQSVTQDLTGGTSPITGALTTDSPSLNQLTSADGVYVPLDYDPSADLLVQLDPAVQQSPQLTALTPLSGSAGTWMQELIVQNNGTTTIPLTASLSQILDAPNQSFIGNATNLQQYLELNELADKVILYRQTTLPLPQSSSDTNATTSATSAVNPAVNPASATAANASNQSLNKNTTNLTASQVAQVFAQLPQAPVQTYTTWSQMPDNVVYENLAPGQNATYRIVFLLTAGLNGTSVGGNANGQTTANLTHTSIVFPHNVSSAISFAANIAPIMLNGTLPLQIDVRKYLSINSSSQVSFSVSATLLENIDVAVNDSKIQLTAQPGYSGTQQMQLFVDADGAQIASNIFDITVQNPITTETEQTAIVNSTQARVIGSIIVGQPVVWRQQLDSADNETGEIIELLPTDAQNVSLYDQSAHKVIGDAAQIASDDLNLTITPDAANPSLVSSVSLTSTEAGGANAGQGAGQSAGLGKGLGNAARDPKIAQRIKDRLNNASARLGLRGGQNYSRALVFNRTTISNLGPGSISSAALQFQTAGPTQSESVISTSHKRVFVQSTVHYENVTVRTTLPKPVSDPRVIRLQWTTAITQATAVNSSQNPSAQISGELTGISANTIPANTSTNTTANTSSVIFSATQTTAPQSSGSTDDTKQLIATPALSFTPIDTDGDGLYDTIQFVAPHLSNQTFDIIYITNAELLDVWRQPISDITPYVDTLDDNWTTVPTFDVVRVTFQQNLTNQNDIKLYARSTDPNATNASILVFLPDQWTPIAQFPAITATGYYDLLLNNASVDNLNSATFDLQVVNSSVDLDYIVDPTAQPGGVPSANTTNLTAQVCAAEVGAGANTFGSACAGTYPAACSTDRLSCNDGVVESSAMSRNLFNGYRIEVYNSTITDCTAITKVTLCYEWWVSASTTYVSCQVAVSNDGGSTYSNISTTCPGTVANPAPTCTDVTASRSWACSNFFGNPGTATAKVELSKSTNTATTLSLDTFYFNVTYSKSPPSISFVSPTLANLSNVSHNFIPVNATSGDPYLKNITVRLFNATSGALLQTNVSTSDPYFLNYTGLTDDKYYVNATATDLDKNTAVTGAYTITLDTKNPAIGFSTGTQANNSNAVTNAIFVNVSVNDTNEKNVTINIYDNVGNLITSATNTTPGITFFQYNFTGLTAGVLSFNATAFDIAGNSNSTGTYSVTTPSVCGVLNTSGQTYKLTNNVSATADCFILYANDTVIDGNGYSITYNTVNTSWGNGVNLSTQLNNITLKNAILILGNTTSYGFAVYGNSSSYSFSNITLQNNTIISNASKTNYSNTIVFEANPNSQALTIYNNTIITDTNYTGINSRQAVELSIGQSLVANNTFISYNGVTILLNKGPSSITENNSFYGSGGNTFQYSIYQQGSGAFNETIRQNTITTDGACLENGGNSLMTITNNSFSCGSSFGIVASGINMTIADNNITAGTGLWIQNNGFANSTNNTLIYNNTINSSGTHVIFDTNFGTNTTFYHNNLSGTGTYIDDRFIGQLTLNASVNGVQQGNIYGAILSINVTDTNGDGWGDTGSAYPLNKTTWASKFTSAGNATDYAPWIGVISFITPTPLNGSTATFDNFTVNATSLQTGITNFNITIYNSSNSLVQSWSATGSNVNNTFIDLDPGVYYFNATSTNSSGIKYYSPTWQVTVPSVCRALNITGKYYLLGNNVSSAGSCYNVTANNVVLDLNGYKITYDTGSIGGSAGVNVTSNNFTVKNGIVTSASSSVTSDTAISSNSTIARFQNVSINLTNSGTGIGLLTAYSNIVVFNDTISVANIAISAGSSAVTFGTLNVIANSTFKVTGTAGSAIRIKTPNWIIENNTGAITGSTGTAIAITNSQGTNITVQRNNFNISDGSFFSNTVGATVKSYIFNNTVNASSITNNCYAIQLANLLQVVDNNITSSCKLGAIGLNKISTNASNNVYVARNNINASAGAHINVSLDSGTSDVFVYNNFTGTALYIYDLQPAGVYFNTTVNGTAQGNYYSGIESIDINDTDNDGWGDSGAAYPLNATNWPSKWSGNGTDYGPYTTRHPDAIYVYPTPANGSTTTFDNITINISLSAALTSALKNATIYVYNSTGGLAGSYFTTSTPLFLNLTDLDPGQYTFNATIYNTSNTLFLPGNRTVTVPSICRTLSVSAKTYKLANDVTSTISCFVDPTANNVILDGNGHVIKFDTSAAGHMMGVEIGGTNFTLKNAIISINTAGGNDAPLYISNTDAKIYNVTIHVNGSTNLGVQGAGSFVKNTLIENSTILGFMYEGITLSSAANFTLRNSTISGITANGNIIDLSSTSNSTFVNNTLISATNAGVWGFIFQSTNSNITIVNNTIRTIDSALYAYNGAKFYPTPAYVFNNTINANCTGTNDPTLQMASNMIVADNNISTSLDNGYGLINYLQAFPTSNTTIQHNWFNATGNNGSSGAAIVYWTPGAVTANNTVFYNNFTGNVSWGISISNTSTQAISFNTTVGGIPQGNYYTGISSLRLTDSNGDGWADGGADYPVGSTTWARFFATGVSANDYGPWIGDTTPPAISFVSPTPASGSATQFNNITINVTASDFNGLQNITIFLYNSSAALIASSNSTTSPLYWNAIDLDPGQYFFNASAYDTYGNVNYTATYNVTVPSVCTNLNVSNKVYKLANNVNASGTCFTVEASNITLDGNGHNITMSGGYGVDLFVDINTGLTLNNITIQSVGINATPSTTPVFGITSSLSFVSTNVNVNNVTINLTSYGNVNGIYMNAGGAQMPNWVISNSIIDTRTNDSTVDNQGIYFESPASIIIANNTLYHNGGNSFGGVDPAVGLHGNYGPYTISNNTLYINNTQGILTLDSVTTSGSITANTLRGGGYKAAQISGFSNKNVTGNYFEGTVNLGTGTAGNFSNNAIVASSSSAALNLSGSLINATVWYNNITADASGVAVLVPTAATGDSNTTIFYNLFNASGPTQVLIQYNASSFIFAYNNFTSNAALYVNNTAPNVSFNTTVGGVAQGNYYANISSLSIFDITGDGWADAGTNYPLNATNWPSKWVGFGADYAPWTGIVPDPIPPIISFVAPTPSNASTTTFDNITINVSATDNLAVKNVTISVYNSSGSLTRSYTATGGSASLVAYLDAIDLLPGAYSFNASAYDYNGNLNITSTYNVTVPSVCRPLNVTGLTYKLVNNVRAYQGTCFNITANGTTLDGNGYNLTANSTTADEYLVRMEGALVNLSLKNLRINQTYTVTNQNLYGIWHDDGIFGNNVTITNVSINFTGSTSSLSGIWISSLNNLTVENSIVGLQGSSTMTGMHVYDATPGVVANNTVAVNLGGSDTLRSIGGDIQNLYDNSFVENNTFAALGDSASVALNLQGVSLSTTLRPMVRSNSVYGHGPAYGMLGTTLLSSDMQNNLIYSEAIAAAITDVDHFHFFNNTVYSNSVNNDGLYVYASAVTSDFWDNNLTTLCSVTPCAALHLDDGANGTSNTLFRHNLLNGTAGEDLLIGSSIGSNITLAYNTFASTLGYVVNNNDSRILFNITNGSVGNGNYYADIGSLALSDSNVDGWADGGASYPPNATTWSGVWIGYGADYAPWIGFNDFVAPNISFVSPTTANNSALSTDNIAINVTAADNVHLISTTINVYNSTKSLVQSQVGTSPNYLNLTNMVPGTYYFNATALDENGNVNTTGTYNITILTACRTISVANTYYKFTSNLTRPVNTNTCFDVLANNVTIDGNGYTITLQNTSATGSVVFADNVSNITLKNLVVWGNSTNGFWDVVLDAQNSNRVTFSNINANMTNAGVTLGIYGTNTSNLIVDNATLDLDASDSGGLNTVYDYGENITVQNSLFITGARYAQPTNGVQIDSGSVNAKVINNSIYDYSGGGLITFTTVYGPNVTRNVVANNSIYEYLSAGIMVNLQADQLDIYNNTFFAAHGASTQVSGTGVNMSRNILYQALGSPGASVLTVYSAQNSSFTNNTLTDPAANATALVVTGVSSTNNTFTYNKINGSGAADLYADGNVTNTIFAYNNFTGTPAYYINSSNSAAYFNTTVAGVAQGNYYDGITSINILDSNADGWGDAGSDYPLSSTTWPSKWLGNGIDWGPATTLPIACMDITKSGVYTLVGNLSATGTCFNVQSDNVTLDLAGHSITFGTDLNNFATEYGVQTSYKNTVIANGTIIEVDTSSGLGLANTEHLYMLSADKTYVHNLTLVPANPLGGHVIDIFGATNVTVANISIPYAAGLSTGRTLVNLNSVQNVLVTNSTLEQTGYAVGAGGNNVNITNNVFNTTSGIILSTTGSLVQNNTVVATSSALTLYSYANTINVTQNDFKTSYDNANGDALISAQECENCSFTYNTVNSTNTSADIRLLDVLGNPSEYRVKNTQFLHNNFSAPAGILLNITNESGSNNTFAYNNFTGAAQYYVYNNYSGTTNFNVTVGGVAQGNYYSGVESKNIGDWNGDGYGEMGTDYPVNATTWSTKWFGYGQDFGPQTSAGSICGAFSISGNYFQSTDLTSAGNCLTINAPNVVIDGKGHTINYDISSGANGIAISTGGTNATIKNMILRSGNLSTSFANGISSQGENSSFTNNTFYFNVSGLVATAVSISGNANNNVVFNNTIIATNGGSILVNGPSNATVANNSISTVVTVYNGNIFFQFSAGGLIENNSISSTSNALGIYVIGGNNLNIRRNTLSLTGADNGLWISGTSPVTIFNNSIHLTNPFSNSGMYLGDVNNSQIVDNNVTVDGTGFANAINLDSSTNSSGGNYIARNLLNSSLGTQLNITANAGSKNVFAYNNFTGSSSYIIDSSPGANYFNTTVAGVAQGNYYSGITSLRIYDINADGWADVGADYPLSASTWPSEWSGYGTDYGPATTNVGSSCAQLNAANTVYTLKNDVFGTDVCFNITASNITFDGAGYTINISPSGSTNAFGIMLYNNSAYGGISNITIKNVKIQEFGFGGPIRVIGIGDGTAVGTPKQSNIVITNVSINISDYTDGSYGINLGGCSNLLISNSTTDVISYGANEYGIYSSCSNANISFNTIFGGWKGLSYGFGTSVGGSNWSVQNNTFWVNNTAGGLLTGQTFNGSWSLVDGNSMHGSVSIDGAAIMLGGDHILLAHNTLNLTAYDNTDPASYAIQVQTLNNSIVANNSIQMTSGGDVFVLNGNENTLFEDNAFNGSCTAASRSLCRVEVMMYVLDNSSKNISFLRNTFNYNATFDVFSYDSTGSVVFAYNNFTGAAQYFVNSSDPKVQFNTAVNGIPQGNYYAGIGSQNITDMTGDGWGDIGSDYPVNATTWSSKWVGNSTDYGPAVTRTDSICGNIITANIYTLANNVSGSGTCFNVLVDNVTLNLNGYMVRYGTAGGAATLAGVYSRYSNLVVANGTIVDGNYSSGGITVGGEFPSAKNTKIRNVTFVLNNSAGSPVGVYANNDYYTNISNCSIVGNSAAIALWFDSSEGIYLADSSIRNASKAFYPVFADNITIRNTSINTTNGIDAFNMPSNLFVSDSTIDVSGASANAIDIGSATTVSIKNNILFGGMSANSGARALYIQGVQNLSVNNNTVYAGGPDGWSVYVNAAQSNNAAIRQQLTNNVFIALSNSTACAFDTDNWNLDFLNNTCTAANNSAMTIQSTSLNASANAFYSAATDASAIDIQSGLADSSLEYNNITSLCTGLCGAIRLGFGAAANSTTRNNYTHNWFNSSGNAQVLAYADIGENNTFAYNNFTGSSQYFVNNSDPQINFNNSIGGVAQGNYYSGIESRQIADWNGDGYGDGGFDYPVNATSWSSKWAGYGTDYGPITSLRDACSNITSSGSYTFYNDIVGNSTCIVVSANNVKLDLNGHQILYGTAGATFTPLYGIYASSVENTTIINGTIIEGGLTFFEEAHVGLYSTKNAIVENMTLLGNISNIYLTDGLSGNADVNTTIKSITALSNYSYIGIKMFNSRNGTIAYNTIKTFASSISMQTTYNMTITSNVLNGTTAITDFAGNYTTASYNLMYAPLQTSFFGSVPAAYVNFTQNVINTLRSPSILLSACENCSITHNSLSSANSSATNNAVQVGDGSFVAYTPTNLVFSNNTLNMSGGTALNITANAGSNNTFTYNNFTGTPASFVNNAYAGTTNFNTTVAGVAQGNYYTGIAAKNVFDSNADGWGDSGTDYPISASTWPSMWTGAGADYGPATTRTNGNTTDNLVLTNISFSNMSAIEGDHILVYVNVTNSGTSNYVNGIVQLNISVYNGTQNLVTTYNFTGVNVTVSNSTLLTYNWTVPVGKFIFDAMVDPANSLAETSETDNNFTTSYYTTIWTIFYGVYNSTISVDRQLAGQTSPFKTWEGNLSQFNLYYADYDATYFPSNLRPFNQTSDFRTADSALNVSGYNDSIRAMFDKNNDGVADQTASFTIGGQTINNVPVINSTNTNSFITGILWDASAGGNYNGSQALVIVTKVNYNKAGQYGTYDYEVRVPSGLQRQFPSTDILSRLDELI